jgi:hypothetical protein
MERLFIERKAEDNKYLHRDFHLLADRGLIYVGENYGDQAVVEFLTEYTKSYYKNIIKEITQSGISVFRKHLEKVYLAEESEDALSVTGNDDFMTFKIKYCPGVKYMLNANHVPSKWYIETVNTVYGVIARESGYTFELVAYDQKDGASEFNFRRGK